MPQIWIVAFEVYSGLLLLVHWKFNGRMQKLAFRGFPDTHPELLKDIPPEQHPRKLSDSEKRFFLLREMRQFKTDLATREACILSLEKERKTYESEQEKELDKGQRSVHRKKKD